MFAAAPAISKFTEAEKQAMDARLSESYHGDPLNDEKVRGIFVLVNYSRNNFFIDAAGHYRGFEYDLLKGYEKFLNKGKKGASERKNLIFIPMPFRRILPALVEGRGDIAAASITITDARLKKVDFSKPYIPGVSEIVVMHKDEPMIEAVEDLAGREVYVLANSSWEEHLRLLNRRFKAQGLAPIEIVVSSPGLQTVDILELVNAGSVPLTVVDDYMGKLWSRVFPNIALRPEVAIHTGANIAWALRKGTPALKASLNSYVKTVKKGTLLGNIAFKQYYKSSRWIKNPLVPGELRKLEKVVEVMKRYSKRYNWDWIAVAAQAYQESGLDQSKVSPAGAIGIMQLLPSTAAGNPINIENITTVENNIHAGVKYLAYLRNQYFDDPAILPIDRVDFSLAAYNAGPGRIAQLRKVAAQRGYDPNKWFFNVEHIASEKIGRETVTYVANVNKYYAAYKYAFDRRQRRIERQQKKTQPVK